MSLLRAAGISAGYSGRDDILKDVGIEVGACEIVAILGPNGAGKSTLLKTIAGLVTPRSGTLDFDGRSIAGLTPRDVSRRGVVFVPQEANVFPSLTIQENLEIGGYLDRKEMKARVAEVCERIPVLSERRRAKARTLSGGERQLLAMGMALMVGPRILLLDEPTAGLSPLAAETLFRMIKLIRDTGVAVTIVEQNAILALNNADRAYILVDGRNARSGPARDMLEDREIRRVFLGDVD